MDMTVGVMFQLWCLFSFAASAEMILTSSCLDRSSLLNVTLQNYSPRFFDTEQSKLGDSSQLFARQQCPPGSALCPDGIHCADIGWFCCTASSKQCRNGNSCCPASDGGGCVRSGNSCCGQYQCEPHERCCGDKSGCVKADNTCCGQYQCKPTEKCCGNGEGCAPTTGTCCSPGYYCVEGAKCCVDQELDKFCAENCVETMTLDFNEYAGMEEIFENMCRGIVRGSNIQPGEMILEYNGKGSSARNRNIACGKLQCAKVFGAGWQCDEFPFASSVEGGSLAAVMCVPGKHNRAIGGKWGSMVRGKVKGTKFRVKITNFNCANVFDRRQLEKRAGAVLRNDTDAIYLRGSAFGNYSQGPVAMIQPVYIPDEFVGKFIINSAISQGQFISGVVMDDEGTEFGSIMASSSITIDVGQTGVGNIFILGWTQDTLAAVSISTTLQSATSTAASTATRTVASTAASTVASTARPISSAIRTLEGSWCWKSFFTLFLIFVLYKTAL